MPLRLPRVARHRSRSLVGILLLSVVLASFLAYEAWSASHRHRASARRVMNDYAKFAAWEFTSSAKESLYSTLVWVFSPIAQLQVRHGDPLPPPSVLASEKVAGLLCPGDSSRYHFLLDLRTKMLATSGDDPPLAMRQWIVKEIPYAAKRHYKPDMSYALASLTVDGRPRTLVYQVRYDMYHKPAAAYGFELCLGQFASGALEKVMTKYAALPPSLTRGAPNDSVPNDSIFSVRVADGSGHEIFRSAVQYPPTYSGDYTLDAFGGLHTRVSLNPSLERSLLIGGLPRDRLPLLLSVLALTIALAFTGVMQLRREDELARLRADFVASVSHELRTPLAQVRMFAETLLLGRVRNEEERVRSLRIVDQEARRLAHLVENILQFSRAERQGIALAPVETELASQVEDALESFGPVARARKVVVEPALERGLYAMVDPGAFRQILLNLLDNAVKYGPAGQTVRVSLAARGGRACLTVDDEGPGVPPKERARVWEAFQRLDSAVQSAVAGSGIGLAVVAELIALQGGRAWIDDAPGGRGARFVVELPLVRVRAEEGLVMRALPPQESIPS